MIVRRLLIAEYPLLQQAAAFLADVTVPSRIEPSAERGDWRADVDGPPPARNRPQPLAYRRVRLPCVPRALEWMDDASISALNFYPRGGAGIGWHTDTGHPGWRVYVALPLSSVPGIFRTVDGDYYDVAGSALAFFISGEPCATWHAVRSDGPRLSIGIRFSDGPTQRALGLYR